VQQFWEKVTEALSAGTFDARLDRHLTWCSLLVDQQGWNQVHAHRRLSSLLCFEVRSFPT